MKKTVLLIAIVLVVCFVSVFALSACNLEKILQNIAEGDGYVESKADTKDDSMTLINGFLAVDAETANLVVTVTTDGKVQYTENIVGANSCVVYADGTTVYAYKVGEVYYYMYDAPASEESNAYQNFFCSDEAKSYYYEEAENYYNNLYCYFLSNFKIFELLPEEGVTYSCLLRDETKDGKTTSTLTAEFTTKGGTIRITGTADEGKVQSVSIVVNDASDEQNNRNISMAFAYGSAVFEAPDLDAIVAAQQAKAAREEANRQALDERDEFWAEMLGSDNVVVTVSGVMNLTETIVGDLDCVDYGSYKTYTYYKEVDEDTTDYYFVFDGAEEDGGKYFMRNPDDDIFAGSSYVYYNSFLALYDLTETEADVVLTCEIEENVMTFCVKKDDAAILTITATKSGNVVNAISIAYNTGATCQMTISYDTGSLTYPDLSNYTDASVTDEGAEE